MSAATVAAVGTVAAAGVAAYNAKQQHDAANSASQTGTKVEPVPYNDRVGTSDSYAQQLYAQGGDMQSFMEHGLPMNFDIARRVNEFDRRKRERMTGGTFGDTIQQEGANILGMERGQVPQDVIDSVNRIVAENLGGATMPGAGSLTSNNAARNLGLTSLDLMKTGMGAGAAWRSNVDSFLYKPQDAARDFFFPAANVALNASQLQMQRDQNEYISANNIARAGAMPDPRAVGSLNNNLQANTAFGKSAMDATGALAGLYNSFKTPTNYGTNLIGERQFATGTVPKAQLVNPAPVRVA